MSRFRLLLLCALALLAPRAGAGADVRAQGCVSNISLSAAAIAGYGTYQGLPLVNDAPGVSVKVTSNCLIQTVEAVAFGDTTPLTFSNPLWVGTLNLVGKARVSFTLTFRAVDINGTVATTPVTAVHDLPPAVAITEPTVGRVARPGLRIATACTDDNAAGCQSLTVYGISASVPAGVVLLSGATSYDQVVSLAAFDGQAVTVRATGVDSSNTSVTTDVSVFVESNPHLVEVFRTPGNKVMDESLKYILIRTPNRVDLYNKENFVTTTMLSFGSSGAFGFATDRGAIISYVSGGTNHIVESRDGVLTDLGTTSSADLRAAGGYAHWGNIRRDLSVPSNVTIPESSGADVAVNGDVVYKRCIGLADFDCMDFQIFRYRGGVTTQMTPTGRAVQPELPLTDGINIAYRTSEGTASGFHYTIRLIVGVSQIIASDMDVTYQMAYAPQPRTAYAVNNGWFAFVRQAGETRNLWMRSPTGTESMVSQFGDATVAIAALNDDGRLVFTRAGRLYLWQPGHQLRDLGSSDSRTVIWRRGRLYIMLGDSLFRLGGASFTDEVLTRDSSSIKAVHITELRARIDAARAAAGLSPFSYTNPAPTAGASLIRAQDIVDLRNAVAALYTAAGLTPPTYTDPSLTTGMVIRLEHITELRIAVTSIE